MMRLFFILGLGLLTACTSAQQDQLAQDAAKRAVRPVYDERLPGVPVETAVDSVIDNATEQEILTLAADAVTGPTASTVEVTTRILARPETIRCVAEDGLPVLLGAL